MKKLIRDPKIVWRVEKQREAQVIAAMEAGEEAAEQGTVILIAAGTMHQLNYVGGRIWQLCDGTHDTESVIVKLQDEFDVDRDALSIDVHEFINDLLSKGWLSYEK